MLLVVSVHSAVSHLVLINLEEVAATKMSMKMKILLKEALSMIMVMDTVKHLAEMVTIPNVSRSWILELMPRSSTMI